MVAVLIVTYFILTYRHQSALAGGGGSYSETEISTHQQGQKSNHTGLKALAGALGGAAAIEAFRKHRRSREERRAEGTASRPHSRHNSRPSSPHSESYAEEKFSEEGGQQHTWRNRLLTAAAAGGTIAAVRGWMNRRRGRDDESYVSSYTRPPGPANFTQDDVSRVNAGYAPASPANVRRPRPGAAGAAASLIRPGHRRAGESISSYTSADGFADAPHHQPREEHHGLRDGIVALGVAGYAKHLWDRRRRGQEDARVDEIRRQDRLQEEVARRNSQRRRFTGDGSPSAIRFNRPAAGGSIATLDDSAAMGAESAFSRPGYVRPGATPGPHTLPTASVPSVTPLHPPPSNIPMPPLAPGAVAPPVAPPPPIQDAGYIASESELYSSPGREYERRQRLRHAAEAGAAAGAVAAATDRPHSYGEAVEPVRVKVKMNNDGRSVTLRRLNEAEAAAERDARRRDPRRRNGSFSSLDSDDRWRRAQALEEAQAAEMAAAAQGSRPGTQSGPVHMPTPPNLQPHPPVPVGFAAGYPPSTPPHGQVPYPGTDLQPPPPITAAGIGSGVGGASPPSTGAYGTETDLSNYENNRRRRRAERMQARAARGGGSGHVEFE